MPKCSYCGKMYDVPFGLTVVMNDGSVKYLCSSKCRKNLLLKRRKVRWAEGVESTKGKGMKSKKKKSKKKVRKKTKK